MNNQQAEYLINRMIENGYQFEAGLSQQELTLIEQKFDLSFPTDLKLFLQTKLPIDEGFPNWRGALTSDKIYDDIIKQINWSLEGILFDIEYANSWYEQWWGAKPNTLDEQKQKFTDYYHTCPKLIPIYGHRFIPSEPNFSGNPVFSVYQLDIIYYGYDLSIYLGNEFISEELPDLFNKPKKPNRTIRFWGELVEFLDAEFVKSLSPEERERLDIKLPD